MHHVPKSTENGNDANRRTPKGNSLAEWGTGTSKAKNEDRKIKCKNQGGNLAIAARTLNQLNFDIMGISVTPWTGKENSE